MRLGGGGAAMNEFFRACNVLGIPAGNAGAQTGDWYRRKIKTLADVKGMKMRIGGLGGLVLAKLRLVAGGARLQQFAKPMTEASLKAADDQYGELSTKSPEFKKICKKWVKFRDEQNLWFCAHENSFDSLMATHVGRG